MNTIQMTIENAVSLIQTNCKGSEFITVDLECPLDNKMKTGGRARTNKLFETGCFYKATMNGNLAGKYIEAVNRMRKRQCEQEGTEFEPVEAKKHPWGDLDAKRLFRIHRNTLAPYLHMRCKNEKFGGRFQANGEPLTDEQEAMFAQYKKPVKAYGSSTQEGLKKKVIVKDFALCNIRRIRMRGIEIEIVS